MKRVNLLISMIVLTALLAGCATPTAEVVEKVVTQVVKETVKETVIVEGTPKVIEKEVTRLVEITTTPETTGKWTGDKFGGTLNVALESNIPTMDAMTTVAAVTSFITYHVYEHIVEFGEDYSLQPGAAESWEISPDGKTYTFHLRQGRLFHNGKEMTSEDVIASIKRYMEVGGRAGQFVLLESWEAIDKYTFAMHLSGPSGSFLDALAIPTAELVIMPKEVALDADGNIVPANELKIPEDIIGTGPYEFVEWKPDQYVKTKRFNDYEVVPGERNGLATAGKIPYTDEIVFHIVTEPGAALAGLEIGEYDWIGSVPSSEFDRLEEDPGMELQVVIPGWTVFLMFNHSKWPGNNLKFRQAIQAGLDFDTMGLVTMGREDLVRTQPCIWPPEVVWNHEPETAALYNQKDIEKAKQLLKEAGYDGQEILVSVMNSGAVSRATLAAVEQMENNLGLNLKVEAFDWPGLRARWEEKDSWDISSTSYNTPRLLSPDAWASYIHSSSSSPERGFLVNEEVDKALDDLAKAVTLDERKEKVKELQRVFDTVIPLLHAVECRAVQVTGANVKNFKTWYKPRFFSVWIEE